MPMRWRILCWEYIDPNNLEKIAEIGVKRGQLTKKILGLSPTIIKEYWAVDPWACVGDPHYTEEEYDEDGWNGYYFHLCQQMQIFPQLKILRMLSEQAAKLFVDGYFDLVFIDACHTYESTKEDINLWMPKVRKGGFLSGHDYKVRPHYGVIEAVDEIFKGDVIINGTTWIKPI